MRADVNPGPATRDIRPPTVTNIFLVVVSDR
jgi:hypothetical protein